MKKLKKNISKTIFASFFVLQFVVSTAFMPLAANAQEVAAEESSKEEVSEAQKEEVPEATEEVVSDVKEEILIEDIKDLEEVTPVESTTVSEETVLDESAAPVKETEGPVFQTVGALASVKVCKVIIDSEGNIVSDWSAYPGATFSTVLNFQGSGYSFDFSTSGEINYADYSFAAVCDTQEFAIDTSVEGPKFVKYTEEDPTGPYSWVRNYFEGDAQGETGLYNNLGGAMFAPFTSEDTAYDGQFELNGNPNTGFSGTLFLVNEEQKGINPSCDASVNLFQNGDFENPNVGGNWNIYPDGTPSIGWQVAWQPGSGNGSVANLEIHGGVSGWQAYEGVQYAELDSDFDGPSGSIQNDAGSTRISQEVSTIPGQTYTITFAFAGRPGTGESENRLQVYIDDIAWQLFERDNTNGTQPNWGVQTVTFTAVKSNTVISFGDVGVPNSFGTLIDDISIKCTDEPTDPEDPTDPDEPTDPEDPTDPEEPSCPAIIRISENGREGMIKVSKVNPRWATSIEGTNAKWVWNNASIPVFPDRQDGGVFTVNETINIVGNPQDSEIKIAADNVYSVVVNGNTVYGNPSLTPADIENIASTESRFSTVYTHIIPASYLNTGSNTIEIRAVNQKWTPVLTSESTATNPAGLMYALTINEDCDGEDGEGEDDLVVQIPNTCVARGTENFDIFSGLSVSYLGSSVDLNDVVKSANPTSIDVNTNGTYTVTYTIEYAGITDIVERTIEVKNRCSGGGGGSSSGGSSRSEGEVLGATSCVAFTTYNRLGNKGGEIKALQKFLNEYMNAGLTVDGVYGRTTAQAVHDFQAFHWKEVIDPWTPPLSPNTTGWQYKSTRATINAIIDCPEAPVFLEDPAVMYSVTEVENEKPFTPEQMQKIYDLLIEAQTGDVLGATTVNVDALDYSNPNYDLVFGK